MGLAFYIVVLWSKPRTFFPNPVISNPIAVLNTNVTIKKHRLGVALGAVISAD